MEDSVTQDCLRPMSVGVYDLYANKTFIAFTGPDTNGHPFVAEYDHSSNMISGIYQAGICSSGYDKHNFPQIVQSPGGYLHVFYANQLGSQMRYSRSRYPHRIDLWDDVELNLRSEYPKPMVARDGAIFFFNREILRSCINGTPCTGTFRHPQYVKSYDDGQTWSKPQLAMDRWNMDDLLNEMYIGQIVKEPYRQGVDERWHFVWMLAGGTRHDSLHKDIFHVEFSPETDHFYSADGTDLGNSVNGGASLAEDEMYLHCRVVNTGDPDPDDPNYINFVVIDSAGVPVVNQHKWNGSSWQGFSPVGLSGTPSSLDWYDGLYFAYVGQSVYSSPNAVNWTLHNTISLPQRNNGVALQVVPITQPSHPAARLWLKEQNSLEEHSGLISLAGPGATATPGKIIVLSNPTYVKTGDICTVYAFVCDSGGARLMGATNQVQFSLQGSGELLDFSVDAVEGIAHARFRAPADTGASFITATSPSLREGIVRIKYGSNGNPSSITGIKDKDGSELLKSYVLEQNYPNPFNPSTLIHYQISVPCFVSLRVYDIYGRQVAALVDGIKESGNHTSSFNVSMLASGVYFYRLKAGSFIQTKKMTVIK